MYFVFIWLVEFGITFHLEIPSPFLVTRTTLTKDNGDAMTVMIFSDNHDYHCFCAF